MNFKTCTWALVLVVLVGLGQVNGAVFTTVRGSMTAVEPGSIIAKTAGVQPHGKDRQSLIDRLHRLEAFQTIITSLMNSKTGVPRSFLNQIKAIIS